MRKLDPAKHAIKRQQILEAALGCFAEKGFHQTRTADICKAAKMSPGNLFHYFSSKEAIIEEAIEQDRSAGSALLDRLQVADDLSSGLVELVESLLDASADRMYLTLSFEVAAESLRNPRMAEVVVREDAKAKAFIADLLRQGVKRGQVDPTLDVDSTTHWLMAICDGLLSRRALDPLFEIERERPMLRELVTRFLRPAVQG